MRERSVHTPTLAQLRRDARAGARAALRGMHSHYALVHPDDPVRDDLLERYPDLYSPNVVKRARARFRHERDLDEHRTLAEVRRELWEEHGATEGLTPFRARPSLLAALRRELRTMLEAGAFSARLIALARAVAHAAAEAASVACATLAGARADERDHLAGAPPGARDRIASLFAAPGAPGQARVSLAAL